MCEDNMLFSCVKIHVSCFRMKADLVFHWCLYKKLLLFQGMQLSDITLSYSKNM